MRVIEEKAWQREVTCTGAGNGQSGCGSKLEIGKEDIRYYGGKSGDPSVDGTFFAAPEAAVIRCPVCKVLTDLSKADRPEDFKDCKPFTSAWKRGEEPNDL